MWKTLILPISARKYQRVSLVEKNFFAYSWQHCRNPNEDKKLSTRNFGLVGRERFTVLARRFSDFLIFQFFSLQINGILNYYCILIYRVLFCFKNESISPSLASRYQSCIRKHESFVFVYLSVHGGGKF